MLKRTCSACGIEVTVNWRYCPKCGTVAPPPVVDEAENERYNSARIRCNTCKRERREIWIYTNGKRENLRPSYCIVCGDKLEIVESTAEVPFFSGEIRIIRYPEIKLAVPPEVLEKIREEFGADPRVAEIRGPYSARSTHYYVLEVVRGASHLEMKDELRQFVGV